MLEFTGIQGLLTRRRCSVSHAAPGWQANWKACHTGEVSRLKAGVVELVDTPDLGSGGESRGGSSPFARTTTQTSVRGYR